MIIRSFNDHEQMKFLQNIQKTVWGQTFLLFFFKLGFTPCQAEQPLQGIELQEKQPQKD